MTKHWVIIFFGLEVQNIFTPQQIDLILFILLFGFIGGVLRAIIQLRRAFAGKNGITHTKSFVLFIDVMISLAFAPVAALLVWMANNVLGNDVAILFLSVLVGIGGLDIILNLYRTYVPDSQKHDILTATGVGFAEEIKDSKESLEAVKEKLTNLLAENAKLRQENMNLRNELEKIDRASEPLSDDDNVDDEEQNDTKRRRR
jgi:hypothetical protein